MTSPHLEPQNSGSSNNPSLRLLLDNPQYWLITAILFFERFIYYGFRSFLVLFLTDTIANGGLALTKEDALVTYGTFTLVVYTATFFGGFLSDVNQKHLHIIIGGLATMVIAFIWFSQSQASNYLLPLLVIGGVSGVIKVCLYAKFGHLAQQIPQFSLNIFAGSYFAVNLGAACAPLVIGMIATSYGFSLALYLCAAISIIPIIAAVFNLKKSTAQDEIAISQPANEHRSLLKGVLAVLLILVLNIVFWVMYESISIEKYQYLQQLDISLSVLTGATVVISLFSIGMLHKMSKLHLFNLVICFAFMAATGYLVQMASGFNDATKILMVSALTIAIAEVLFATYGFSFICQHVPRRFIASGFGIVLLSSALASIVSSAYHDIANSFALSIQISMAITILLIVLVVVYWLFNNKTQSS